jgi:hypothetical protein
MAFALYPSIVFTVLLLMVTVYFLLGGLPLLILKHDTPVDARFIRGFFNLYYKVAIFTASGACISYALWGRWAFAVGAAVIAILAYLMRKRFIPAMEQAGAHIVAQGQSPEDISAAQSFRKIHIMTLAVNFLQLLVVIGAITRISLG